MGMRSGQSNSRSARTTLASSKRNVPARNASPESTVGAAKAKAEFLAIAEQVHSTEKSITITKRGVPFVRVAPLQEQAPARSIIGCMKGTATILGDIVGPEPDVWEALS